MSFTQWAFIYLGTGAEDPAVDRAEIAREGLTTVVVAVPEPSAVGPVARELVAQGAQSIELCGGLGARGVVDVIEATGGLVPVGGVSYGVEAIPALAALFPSEQPIG